MISLTEVILRVREKCLEFNNRVGGTARLAAITGNETPPDIEMPYAFVVPLPTTTDAPATDMGWQRATANFAVVVCADNRDRPQDGAGKTGHELIEELIDSVRRAVLGWFPINAIAGCSHVRDYNLDMDRARIWHTIEYAVPFLMIPGCDTYDENYATLDMQLSNMTAKEFLTCIHIRMGLMYVGDDRLWHVDRSRCEALAVPEDVVCETQRLATDRPIPVYDHILNEAVHVRRDANRNPSC